MYAVGPASLLSTWGVGRVEVGPIQVDKKLALGFCVVLMEWCDCSLSQTQFESPRSQKKKYYKLMLLLFNFDLIFKLEIYYL